MFVPLLIVQKVERKNKGKEDKRAFILLPRTDTY